MGEIMRHNREGRVEKINILLDVLCMVIIISFNLPKTLVRLLLE